MARISYLNNKFLPHEKAFVHIEDRGFQLADGVYEVILFYNNRLIDADEHFERLFRSLKEIELRFDKSKEELKKIILELFKKNNLNEGSVYLQITRGVSPRSQIFPEKYSPTIIATISPLIKSDNSGIKVMTHADIRWSRCDIKSISLIAGVLAKQHAVEQGMDDAILIKDNFVTEGSFSNIFIVNQEGSIITHEANNNILNGITRKRVISLAQENDIKAIERKFTKEELLDAKEIFLTSSTSKIRPVLEVDNHTINGRNIGTITNKLIGLYDKYINTSL